MSFHIEAAPDEIAETILITGDPLRAEYIATSMLRDARCYNRVRGMLGFTGEYNATRVSIQGTGMGIPSTAIYLHELIHDYKVKRIIRVGTCGAIQRDLELGSILVAESAFTDSAAFQLDVRTMENGVSAHQAMLSKAKRVAAELAIPIIGGPVFSTDLFYNGDESTRWDKWSARGVLAVEMETSVLYAMGEMYEAQVLTLLTVSDNLVTGHFLSSDDRKRAGANMMKLALELATLE